jgi:hypothetical protein
MTIVVGTGPAGLTAAYLLAKKGVKVTLLERANEPGGLWRGFDYNTNQHPIPDRKLQPGTSAHVHFETGMHWVTDSGVPEIDEFWRGLPVERDEIPREIAGCIWKAGLQLNSPYPDVREGREFSNRPILEKLWGVPLEDLEAGADKLIKIDRIVAYDEERTHKLYEAEPRSRKFVAWPDQRTLPIEYQSGVRSFYPRKGLKALVTAALNALSEMGVDIRLGAGPVAIHGSPDQFIWAAGLKSAIEAMRQEWPTAHMTPPRPLTVVNMLLPDETPPHDLHYAFDYTDRPLFRQTWYRNFAAKDPWNRMTLEILGDDIDWVKTSNPGSVVLGIHHLGPTLPVPTKGNERILKEIRRAMGVQVPNVKLIGAGAKAGLFFQPEVLRHVAEVCA